MNSVILITDKSVTIQELLVKLRVLWPAATRNNLGRVVIQDGDSHVSVYFAPDTLEDYGPKEQRLIRDLMPSPLLYLIDYRDSDLIKRVLLGLADDPRMVVDNNAGTILPGPAFVRRLREEPTWDWFEEFRRNQAEDPPN